MAVVLTAVALMAVTGCTGGTKTGTPTPSGSTASGGASSPVTPASPTSSVAPRSIGFTDCSTQVRSQLQTARAASITFSCGKVEVPVDYTDPTGPQLQLFLVREHLIAQKPSARIGSLLVNPGGPGASGVNLALGLVSQLSSSVWQHFDVVGFDPRGVGLSSPVSCIADAQKDAFVALDPDVRTPAGRTVAKSAADLLVKGCLNKYGNTVTHIDTEETARDMDLLRSSLGDQKLTYLGFSYGTRLGSVYAHEYPTRVRAEVLDGAEDPSTDELATDEQQVQGFEAAFDQFAADCVKRSSCAPLGNPRAAVQKLIAAANSRPIPSSKAGETRRGTGGIVTLAVVSALYDQSSWAPLGQALLAAEKGDSKQLFALADSYSERDASGKYSNVMDANLAVNCNDSRLSISDALVQQKAQDWTTKYPIFGKSAAAALYSCNGWPKSTHPLPSATAPGAPPVLVVGTVHDPATPYAGAAILAKTLGSGVVLSWDGQGHTAYLKSSCITTKVDAYLITTQPPSSDSCPAS